jgi:two-component system response regulator AtoC
MKILLVENDDSIRSSLSRFLTSLGHSVFQSANGKKALDMLTSENVHLVLSDIRMPEMDGQTLLKTIKNDDKLMETAVVLFTGHGDIKGAVEAMKNGAYDYLLKPINVEELDILIDRISEFLLLKQKNKQLTEHFDDQVEAATRDVHKELDSTRKALARELGAAGIGILSDSLRTVFETAKKLHHNPDIPALIVGETGTGKELVARYIHFGDGDVWTPFVPLNCAAISSELFESELFGYEAGTFTGGHPKGKKGKLELARDGTLFLDEITEMPLAHQNKLLRVIQEREYYRVGGLERLTTNARFICATNRNIQKCIVEGNFRQDLYFRLNVGYIIIPPLRERKEEILPLALMFLNNLRERKPTRFKSISPEAAALLEEYPWPGNIRELKNTIERIVLYWNEEEIKPRHLDHFSQTTSSEIDMKLDDRTIDPEVFELPQDGIDLNRFILNIVRQSLEKYRWNKTQTAHHLGISYRVLQTYIKHLESREENL